MIHWSTKKNLSDQQNKRYLERQCLLWDINAEAQKYTLFRSAFIHPFLCSYFSKIFIYPVMEDWAKVHGLNDFDLLRQQGCQESSLD